MAETEPGKQPEVEMKKCKAEGCGYTSKDQWRVDSHYRLKHDPGFAERRKAMHESRKVQKNPQGRPPKALQPKLVPVKEAPKSKPAAVAEVPKPSLAGEAKPKAKSFLDGTRFA